MLPHLLLLTLFFAAPIDTHSQSVWSNPTPSGGPPQPRMFNSTVYDPQSNRLIIFGGCIVGTCQGQNGSPVALNDVWVLTHANGAGGTPTWMQLNPVGGPPSPRHSHVAV